MLFKNEMRSDLEENEEIRHSIDANAVEEYDPIMQKLKEHKQKPSTLHDSYFTLKTLIVIQVVIMTIVLF